MDLSCKTGQIILHKGTRMVCIDIRIPARKPRTKNGYSDSGRKAYIIACPVMPNGQILKRNPKCIGENWKHEKNL
jgi:hypothetical protein